MKNAAILGLLALALTTGFAVSPAAADSGEHECTVDIGLGTPVVSGSFDLDNPQTGEDVANVGGCNLHSALDSARTVNGLDAADGCSIQYDTADDDNVADGEVAEGQTLEEGWSVTAFCDVGVFDATNTLTLS